MMERHQAGQQEKLVEISMEPQSHAGSAPRRSHAGPIGALVAVVLALGLVSAGLTFYFVKCTAPCQQDDAPLAETRKLTERDEQGTYDVFTAETAGEYLVCGWVTLADIRSKEVVLRQTVGGESITLEQMEANEAGAKVFFCQKVLLVDNSRLSISFSASCVDSLFHIHKV